MNNKKQLQQPEKIEKGLGNITYPDRTDQQSNQSESSGSDKGSKKTDNKD